MSDYSFTHGFYYDVNSDSTSYVSPPVIRGPRTASWDYLNGRLYPEPLSQDVLELLDPAPHSQPSASKPKRKFRED